MQSIVGVFLVCGIVVDNDSVPACVCTVYKMSLRYARTHARTRARTHMQAIVAHQN